MSADENGDTPMMPAPNGEPLPDTSATATPGKRKRSAQEENLVVDSNTSTTSRDKATLHENLRILVGLLIKLVLTLKLDTLFSLTTWMQT
jgi:hypothetical protein